jgi:hypothetical protein
MKASATTGSTPAFGGSSPRFHLDETAEPAARALELAGERIGKLRAIHGLDHVKKRHRLLHLVGLQRDDQVQCQVRMCGSERGIFRLRLLHAVLAEHALTRRERARDGVGIVSLADRNQRDTRAIPPHGARGGRDAVPHYAEAFRPTP